MEGEGMMNQEQLNAIKERVAKATPGPWEYDEEERGIWNKGGFNYLGTVTLSHNSAEFIAHAREDVPALVAEVEYLRGMLRDTRKIVRQKVKEVKTLQNACKNHKAKQEALVIKNEQLCEALIDIATTWQDSDEPQLTQLEMHARAKEVLEGEAHE